MDTITVLRTGTIITDHVHGARMWLDEVLQDAHRRGIEVVRIEVHALLHVPREQVEDDPFNTKEQP